MTKSIIIFTDGSFIKKNEKSYGSIGIYFPNREFESIGEPYIDKLVTNQRTEFYAIYKADKIIDDTTTDHNVLIYSDSEYSIKSLTLWVKKWIKNDWIASTGKPVKNV